MASLPCPNEETCGGLIHFTRFDEWDTNAHGVEVGEQDCACDLSADQWEALIDAAGKLPMAEWEADDEAWAELGLVE